MVNDLIWGAARVRAIIAVLVVLAWGLREAPQAQDVLVMLGQSQSAWAWSFLVAGVVWLGVNVWFWSHFALTAGRSRAAPAAFGHRRRRRRLLIALWLPRLLGLVPFIGLSWALLGASDAIPAATLGMMGMQNSGADALTRAAVLIGVLGLVLFRVVIAARRWRPVVGGVRVGFLLLALSSLAAAGAGLALYGDNPVRAAVMVQAGPTILFAAAAMICVGTILTWFGARRRIPVLALLFALAFGLAELRDNGFIPDNHDIRMTGRVLRERPDVASAFRQFLASLASASQAGRTPEAGPLPVVLVATSGGGLAAAFWTATIIGDLADKVPGFSDHLFAISGVSGGALGSVESVAMLREGPGRCASIRICTQRALGSDFLGPTLGSLLYPDLIQRFLPLPVFDDRAAALEAAWEWHWRQVTGDGLLAGPFLDLWPAHHPWPALLLNGTSGITGGRLVTSNLKLAGADAPLSIEATDLLEVAGAELRASTAADNSARFPLFGPTGVLRRGTGAVRPAVDLVLDGGYFEDFGATTMQEMLDVLDEVARRDQVTVRFIVLQIIGAPPMPPVMHQASLLPLGLSGPLVTLLHTRDARGAAATTALARRTAALGGIYVTLRLGVSPTGQTAPLSWALSSVAQQAIDHQWTPACRDRLAREMGLSGGGGSAMTGMNFGQMMHADVCEPLSGEHAPPHS
jgi:hypothetical protein